MNRVTFIRHAESEANAGAATDSPQGIRLTPRGHRQAAELAARFTTAPDLIVVSPYLRTQQTAAPLVARFPQARVEEWPVQEFTYLNSARYAGTTYAERSNSVREYWLRCDPHWNDGGGAESFADFIARVDDLAQRLRERCRFRIAAFTHAYFIKAFRLRRELPGAKVADTLMAAFRDTYRNQPLANTEVIEFPDSFFTSISTNHQPKQTP